MALEAGLAALKMLYQLAKMIKEARDNVLFVREKLDTTESIEEVIQMQLKRIEEGGNCPEAVLKAIKTRLVTIRRIGRRMRMKYEPLVSLLSGLGGSASLIKAQAAMMRKGILGASMALGALSNMVRGHTDRSQKRAREAFERAVKAAGIEASIEEIRANPDLWIEQNANAAKKKINDRVESNVDAISKRANAIVDDVQNKATDAMDKGIGAIEDAQNKVKAKVTEKVGEAKNAYSKGVQMINDAKEDFGDERLKALKDKLPEEYAEIGEQEVDGYYDDFDALEHEVEDMELNIKSLKAKQKRINESVDTYQDGANALVQKGNAQFQDFLSDQVDGIAHSVAHVVKHQLVLFEKLEELDSRIHHMLDDIDILVAELKSLDKEAADNDDDATDDKMAGDMKRETEMGLIPAGRGSKVPPKGFFLETGLDELMKKMSNGKDTLSNACFRKAMAGGYEEAKLNLFKRFLVPGAYANYDERIISTKQFRDFLFNEGKPNVGIGIAAICTSLIAKLNTAGMPKIVIETGKIAKDLIEPIIAHAFAFGLSLQCEDLREIVKDDPDEIAALQAEADEAAMEKRMELIQAFATDFKESFEHGVAPDPSLIVSIAIEAGTSFLGLGPTTRRRIELMYAIASICNIEADKVAIEKVENDMKSELQLMQSLGSQTSHEIMNDLATATFDARRVLGEGDTQDFWVSSFGKDCHEVSWNRFRMSITSFYGKLSRNCLSRMKLMLLDMKGNVPLEHIQAFVSNTGSLGASIQHLQKSEKMPRNLTLGNNTDSEERPKTSGGVSVKQKAQMMSPSEKRQAKLRLYGVVDSS